MFQARFVTLASMFFFLTGTAGVIAFAQEPTQVESGSASLESEPASLESEPASPEFRPEVPSRKRVTNADFPTLLRPEPDSLKSVGKIPPGTPVVLLDMHVVRTGRYKENWYQVEHKGTTGWVRGDDLDGETAEKSFSVTYQAPDMPSTSAPGGVSF